MMNRLLQLTFLSFVLLNTNAAFAETVFVEQNGRLIVEIESAPAVSNWHPTIKFPNYRGTVAYEWTRSGTTGARNADAGALTYHFKINTPGNYEFRWRSRIGEGTNGTESNDSWVKFPTGSNVSEEHALSGWTKGYMNQVGAWSWRTVTVDHEGLSIRQHFTAGEHTLEIAGRSGGHVLDRFALFKYDSVNFNDGVFTNAPQSPYTGDEIEIVTVTPEPEPEPEPLPQPDPQPDTGLNASVENTGDELAAVQLTQRWQIPANQLSPNECSGGVISLQPVSDLYVDENGIVNNGDLLINGAGQRALLNFDLSDVPSTVTSAALTFSVGTQAGEGAVVMSAGSHSDWNNTDTANLPDISHLIGSFNGIWSAQTRYGFSFDPTLISSDTATVVLEMAQGANGITILSSGGNDEPRLELTGADTFCADYEAKLASSAAPEPERKVDVVTEAVAETDGGGSLSLLELLLLTLLLKAVGTVAEQTTSSRRTLN